MILYWDNNFGVTDFSIVSFSTSFNCDNLDSDNFYHKKEVMRDDFPYKVKNLVAQCSAYLCSNPSCNKITIGPSGNNQIKPTNIGTAAHICAASPGGPRYDMSQTSTERKHINNAIWLCNNCSRLIDNNGGIDYPADHLRKWKRDHEELLKNCLQGDKRIVFQFLPKPSDTHQAKKLVVFLEQRGVLFMPYTTEVPAFVMESIKEIRTFLTQLQAELEDDSPLTIIVNSMNHACRYFMNTTDPQAEMKELVYSLGALRKILGLNIGDLEKEYSLQVKGPLKDAIPTY